jgi:hypothetical protein
MSEDDAGSFLPEGKRALGVLVDRSDELIAQAIEVLEAWEACEPAMLSDIGGVRRPYPMEAQYLAIEAVHCSLSVAGYMSLDTAIAILNRSLNHS